MTRNYRIFINSQFRDFAGKYRFAFFYAGLSMLVLLPTVFFGVYKGVDLSQHVQFSTSFYGFILDGEFYPGWAGAENLGYGSVGVRFYPPLTPFLFALMKIIGGSWHAATWLTLWIFTFAGAFGIFKWAGEFASESKAFWAGALFIFVPYHVYQIQNASQLAEYAGCSLLPFSFLFVTRICRGGGGNFRDVVCLAVSFALLILTHLPTTVTGAICLVIYALCLIEKKNFAETVLKLSAGAGAALLATSSYWLKVFSERHLLRMAKLSGDHEFEYFFNFLLSAPWFDKRQLWFINSMFLAMLLGALVLFAAGFFEKRGGEFRRIDRSVFGILFFSFFMCLAPSEILWRTIPVLPEIQFPWRWLTIASVFLPLAFAVSAGSLEKLCRAPLARARRFWKFLVFFVFVCALLLNVIFYAEFQLNHIPKNDYDGWVSEKSAEMGFDHLWTIYARKEAFEESEKIISGDRKNHILKWDNQDKMFFVEKGDSARRVRLATLYYPFWKAKINGAEADLSRDENGVLTVLVPKEKSLVEISFEEPRSIRISKIINGFAFLLFFCFILFGDRSGRFGKKSASLSET